MVEKSKKMGVKLEVKRNRWIEGWNKSIEKEIKKDQHKSWKDHKRS